MFKHFGTYLVVILTLVFTTNPQIRAELGIIIVNDEESREQTNRIISKIENENPIGTVSVHEADTTLGTNSVEVVVHVEDQLQETDTKKSNEKLDVAPRIMTITVKYPDGDFSFPLGKIPFTELAHVMVIPPQAIYACNPDLFGPDRLEPPQLFLMDDKATLAIRGNFSSPVCVSGVTAEKGIISFSGKAQNCVMGNVKDLNIFMLLDDEFLGWQLNHVNEGNIRNAIDCFISIVEDIRTHDEAPASPLLRSSPLKEVASSSVEGQKKVTYTGVDNVLFEKAYTHMLDIFNRYYGRTLSELVFNDSSSPEDNSIKIRQLFCTKQRYLMAMITFLNGCYEAVASEEQQPIVSAVMSEEALSKIPYQWDISDQQGISETIPPLTQELIEIQNSLTSNNATSERPVLPCPAGPPKIGDTPMPELFKLMNVADEEELIRLTDAEFNIKAKSNISLPEDRFRLRHVRAGHKFEIKKAQEREAAAIRAKQREEEYARFQNRKITGKHINSYGETIYHVVLPKKEMK